MDMGWILLGLGIKVVIMKKLNKAQIKSIYIHILKYGYSIKIINDQWIIISPDGNNVVAYRKGLGAVN